MSGSGNNEANLKETLENVELHNWTLLSVSQKKIGQAVRSFYDCMRWLHRKMNGSSSPDLNDNSVWLDFLRSGQKK